MFEKQDSYTATDGVHQDAFVSAAESGNAATDRYGQPLVTFDQAAERKLRLKIDFCIVPTVALLYLFCFIDRANIGKSVELNRLLD